MGCSDCSRLGGCSVRKGEERALLGEILPHLYPTRRWGEPDDASRHGTGVTEREGRSLARRAAEALQARTYFQPGSEGETCDYVYVLCVGREPGLWELREQAAIDVPDGDHVRERYLRLCLSSMARVATLQEVSFELDREDDVYAIRELPRDGVYDPILLKRTRKLVDLVVDAGLVYLDFGVVVVPPDAFDGAAYEREYGQPAGIVNYLFYPQPPTAVGTSYVPTRAA